MDVAVTLTRAELEAPFKVFDPEADPITGPTRTALEIVENAEGFTFIDRDLSVGTEPVEETILPKMKGH